MEPNQPALADLVSMLPFAAHVGVEIQAAAAFLNLPPDASTSTIESKTNLFRGVREGTVHAVARPLHVGRSTIAVQTELRDDRHRLVAITIQTQAVLS